jgi:hypothetical protein
MKKISLLFVLSTYFSMACVAADKHVHGQAEVFIAIQNNQILIELESPAANILGFEYQPKTTEEKTQLAYSIKKLQDYKTISIFPEADCQQVSVNIHSPFKHNNKEHKEHDHSKHSHEHEHEHGHEQHGQDHHHKEEQKHKGHAEFHVTYELNCNRKKHINTAAITAFTHFLELKKVTVNWVTEDNQGSSETTASSTDIKL